MVSRRFVLSGMVLMWIVSCGSDEEPSAHLPKGFENAAKVEVAMGVIWDAESLCDADAPPELLVAEVEGELRVAYRDCFACRWEKLEAFVKRKDAGFEILFQPVQTDAVNACGDSSYTLRLYAGEGNVGDTVSVFTRGDLDSEPVKRAEVVAAAEAVDCAGLAPCGVESPCVHEGEKMDERGDDYTMGCTSLPSCGGAFCIWDAEACMLECGGLDCAMGESYPLTPVC